MSPKRSNERGAVATAGGSAVGGIFVCWLLGYLHVALSAEEGAALSSVLLIIGTGIWRYGLLGIAQRILRGGEPCEPETPESPAVPHS